MTFLFKNDDTYYSKIKFLYNIIKMNNIKKAKFISGDRDIFENFTVGRLIGKGNSFVYEVTEENSNI